MTLDHLIEKGEDYEYSIDDFVTNIPLKLCYALNDSQKFIKDRGGFCQLVEIVFSR